ncbi:hypothetical protein F7Q90_14590 [Pantoea stewartii subsp. stewartii]|nr:hypothetical protein F7Q90_14590 [Pantoea stewartii subsp. stewartii]
MSVDFSSCFPVSPACCKFRGRLIFSDAWALLNKWILCCGTMKTVVSDNIKSMHYMLAYDGVLSGISVFYQNSADKTE